MIKSFIVRLMSRVIQPRNHDEQMLIWAKTEYGKDWQYAYIRNPFQDCKEG